MDRQELYHLGTVVWILNIVYKFLYEHIFDSLGVRYRKGWYFKVNHIWLLEDLQNCFQGDLPFSIPSSKHDSSNLLLLLLGCLDYGQHKGFEGVSGGFWLPALSILLCAYWEFVHLLRQKKNVSVSFAHFEVRLFEEFDVDIRSLSCKRLERGSFQSLYSLCLLGIPTVLPSNSIYLVPVLAWHTKPLPNPSPCRFLINKT